ncbi:MAG TPA: hypothetical protein VJQ82_17935 [Terriglobales bacterium]|nr:hypothetical protein [Terriglobales bacterium]
MADISDVFQSEDFKALPLPEQLKVARRFPEFSGMDPKEQGKILYGINSQGKYGNPEPKPQDQGFFKTLGLDLASLPGSLYQAVRHPQQTAAALEGAQDAQRDLAVSEFKKGNYGQAAARGAAALLPVVGPLAAQAGEELGGGQPRQGAAHATEALLPFALKGAFDAAPDSVKRPVTVAGKTVQNAVKGPNPRFEGGAAAADGRIARITARLKQAYAQAERETPDPGLKAKNAARNPARVETSPQAQPDASPIKPPEGYVRKSPPPTTKTRPVAARVEPSPQETQNLEPIAPPEGYVRRAPLPSPNPARTPARVDVSPREIPSAEPIKPQEGKLPSGRKPGGMQNQAPNSPKPPEASVQNVPVPAPQGRAINLPKGSPEHYGDTAQSFGEKIAKDSIAKDSTIIKHLASKGVTPEQFEAASESQRNVWLRDVNQAAGKRYDPYKGKKGADSAARLLKLWRWAAKPGEQ